MENNKIKHAFVLFVALFFLAAMSVMAGTITVGGPGSSPTDWSQQWNEGTAGGGASVGYFDNLELFIKTPGVYFSDAGGTTDSGWTASLVNSQYVYMTGEDVLGIGFSTDFTTLTSVPFTVDFYTTCSLPAFCTNPVVDSAIIDYYGTNTGGNIGNGWNVDGPAPGLGQENTASPEPASLFMIGTGLLGLGLVSRKRLVERFSKK